MDRTFPETLSALRRQKNISQRQAAADLNISQALLSHYENGAREPGLGFVCRACDYYGVTADYLLCRSDEQGSQSSADVAKRFFDQMRAIVDRAEMALEEFSE
ncbi:MAG: helix-turn-helix transcriptional regulator [Eubacteriales bacterium]|nr:helix-turn-helix transcriptional regulator [Eubacteriales bacterium]